MRRRDYTQVEIHTEPLKKKDRRVATFSLLCIGSRLRKIKWEKTSRRVPGKALGKVTANKGFIS